jgi:hypothetical protein
MCDTGRLFLQMESIDNRWIERFGRPLIGILGKELAGIHSLRSGSCNGQVNSARCGHVSAEIECH